MDSPETDEYALYDSLDSAILMHREAHFGGNFDVMIDYYERGGKGAFPEFTLERIRELQKMEQELGQNLAGVLLSGAEAERVAASKEAYQKLRSLYDIRDKDEVHKYPKLLADLIFSEEEEPEAEINAIVAERSAIVPALLHFLESDDYYDPLFPGYGIAPAAAAKCLGLIGDKRAIVLLFESIGHHDFNQESNALEALKAIGPPAKEFLLHVLHAKPITFDNERAAMALLAFKEDPEVLNAAFNLLKELDLKKNSLLATHLILICEALQDPPKRQFLLDLSEKATTPASLRQDIKAISKHWVC